MNRQGPTRSTAPRMLVALALVLALAGAVSSIAPPPRPVAAAGGLTSVSPGDLHTCGIRSDGTLICWGNNNDGQATPPPGTFTQVSAGSRFTCAIKAVDATLECWGSDSSNQVSDTPSDPVTQVDAGADFACAIKTDETLVCWGNDFNGEVSDAPDGIVTQVSAGSNSACAIKADDTLECWGFDPFGQATPPTDTTFKQVSVGAPFACGITTTDALRCWGVDNIVDKTPTTGSYKQVSVGSYHACAIQMDDTIACWGPNNAGQLDGIPSGTFTQVSAGTNHTCALRADGTVTCWGRNFAGEVGPKITNAPPPNPGPGPYAFSYTADTANGLYEVSFSLTAGSLPPGLTLASDGTVSGTATTEGIYTGTVTLSSDFFRDSQDFILIVDLSMPITIASATANGAPYTFGTWTNQAVTVTLDASDTGSGVANTFYRLDGGSQQTYSGPFAISTEDAHTLTYWSVDNANNSEPAWAQFINIDLTLPVITITGNQSTYAIDELVDVQCTASDALSGIATTDCADITGPATDFGPGSHTVTFTATDNAGNVATLPVTFTVAVTADSLCALTAEYAANRLAGNLLCYPLRLAQFGERLHIPGFTRATTLMYTLLVETQRGRTLTPDEAETLIRLARSL